MTVQFSNFSEDRSTEVRLENEDYTWPELAEEFLAFLQGCGYMISRQDFAEYWAAELPANEEKPAINLDSMMYNVPDTSTAYVPDVSTAYYTTTSTPIYTVNFGSGDTITVSSKD